MSRTKRTLGAILAALVVASGVVFAGQEAGEPLRPFVIHVKTSLSVDDAQICVVPNVAWAALEAGHDVTLVFDGSAVTSVAKGFGWRSWLGMSSTAMDRAPLPERERRSLAEQFGVPLGDVPGDYGAYLHFLRERRVTLYYNRTMAVLYEIDPEAIDPAIEPLGLDELVNVLSADAVYLVY